MIEGEEKVTEEDVAQAKAVKGIEVETKERKIVNKGIVTVVRKRRKNTKNIENHRQALDRDSLLSLIFNIFMNYI